MSFKKNIKSFAFSISVLLGTTNSVFAMNKDIFKIIHNINSNANNGENYSPSFLGNKRKLTGLVKPDFPPNMNQPIMPVSKKIDYMVCTRKNGTRVPCSACGQHDYMFYKFCSDFLSKAYCKECIMNQLHAYLLNCSNEDEYSKNKNYNYLKKLQDKHAPTEYYPDPCNLCHKQAFYPAKMYKGRFYHEKCLNKLPQNNNIRKQAKYHRGHIDINFLFKLILKTKKYCKDFIE